MNKVSMTRGAILICLAIAVAGCTAGESAAKRGLFGSESCKGADRVEVPSGAVYAIYVDGNGSPVGPGAFLEDLTGTKKNMMCPTPDPSTGACPTGYCPRALSGKTYCLRC